MTGSGDGGVTGCPGLAAGETAGLNAVVNVSAPANGGFFVRRARRHHDALQQQLRPDAARHRPRHRQPLRLRSAPRLADQDGHEAAQLHHRSHRGRSTASHDRPRNPKLADPTQPNLAQAADGTITFTLAPVSDEPAGTYTVGVWAKSTDDKDQLFPTLDLQIGNATARGVRQRPQRHFDAASTATAARSRASPIRRTSSPASHPIGNYALDATPIATLQAVPQPRRLQRQSDRAQGPRRASRRRSDGARRRASRVRLARRCRRSPTTPTSSFRRCRAPRTTAPSATSTTRWKIAVANGVRHLPRQRLLRRGTLVPPRAFGKPPAGACTTDAACGVFGDFATCDVPSGTCFRKTHPMQNDDAQCSTCHPADAPGLAPVSAVHEILAVTRAPGLQVTNAVLSGGTGPSGIVRRRQRHADPDVPARRQDGRGRVDAQDRRDVVGDRDRLRARPTIGSASTAH